MIRDSVPRPAPSLALALLAALGAVAGAPCAARADYASCLEGLRAGARGAGVSAGTVSSATENLAYDPEITGFFDQQPEFKTPVWDYLAGLVDDERVEDGKARLAQWGSVLRQARDAYGVDPAIVVAVWGVESDYGRAMGKRSVVRSLATLACSGRRADYFRGEFVAALKILDRGDVNPEHFQGSWAGAFGNTQFMPSTFLRTAVSMDGTGHRDIVDSIPNALGSTARYLAQSGWRSGLPWGFEVKVPAGYAGPVGRRDKHPMSFWSGRGVTRADGGDLGEGEAGLLLPSGRVGPAFLVTRNFDAIYAYNAAETYALAIGHLADRIKGGADFVTPWPTDDPGLSRAERRELQALLMKRGFDVEKADGVIGSKTQAAIGDYQARIGLSRDGRAGRAVLLALRAGK